MTRPPTAIPTLYNEQRYRSRLEARWAIFFDTLRVPFHYEPRGFKFGTLWYVPDFYLPQQEVWVEIKGVAPTAEEQDKAGKLAAATRQNVLLFAGRVWATTWAIGFAHAPDGKSYRSLTQVHWGLCPQCDSLGLYFWSMGQFVCFACSYAAEEAGTRVCEAPRIKEAFERAYDAPLWKSYYQV